MRLGDNRVEFCVEPLFFRKLVVAPHWIRVREILTIQTLRELREEFLAVPRLLLTLRSFTIFAKAFRTTGCAAAVFSLAWFSLKFGISMILLQRCCTTSWRGSTTAGVAPAMLPLFKEAIALIATTSFKARAPLSSDHSFGSRSVIAKPSSPASVFLMK